MEELVKHLVKKKEQVEYLLEKYPATRDNDFYLQYLWLKTFGNLSTKLPYIEWFEMQSIGGQLESVRRVRQKIQNEDHKFMPSPSVLERRKSRATKYRRAIKQF